MTKTVCDLLSRFSQCHYERFLKMRASEFMKQRRLGRNPRLKVFCVCFVTKSCYLFAKPLRLICSQLHRWCWALRLVRNGLEARKAVMTSG